MGLTYEALIPIIKGSADAAHSIAKTHAQARRDEARARLRDSRQSRAQQQDQIIPDQLVRQFRLESTEEDIFGKKAFDQERFDKRVQSAGYDPQTLRALDQIDVNVPRRAGIEERAIQEKDIDKVLTPQMQADQEQQPTRLEDVVTDDDVAPGEREPQEEQPDLLPKTIPGDISGSNRQGFFVDRSNGAISYLDPTYPGTGDSSEYVLHAKESYYDLTSLPMVRDPKSWSKGIAEKQDQKAKTFSDFIDDVMLRHGDDVSAIRAAIDSGTQGMTDTEKTIALARATGLEIPEINAYSEKLNNDMGEALGETVKNAPNQRLLYEIAEDQETLPQHQLFNSLMSEVLTDLASGDSRSANESVKNFKDMIENTRTQMQSAMEAAENKDLLVPVYDNNTRQPMTAIDAMQLIESGNTIDYSAIAKNNLDDLNVLIEVLKTNVESSEEIVDVAQKVIRSKRESPQVNFLKSKTPEQLNVIRSSFMEDEWFIKNSTPEIAETAYNVRLSTGAQADAVKSVVKRLLNVYGKGDQKEIRKFHTMMTRRGGAGLDIYRAFMSNLKSGTPKVSGRLPEREPIDVIMERERQLSDDDDFFSIK